MTTVVHVNKSKFDVYIGRANGDLPQSKWANPFVIGKDGTRDEVIAKYEEYLKGKPELMAALPELKDKVLGCWCHPQKCHGHVLARLIDGEVKETVVTPVAKPIPGPLPDTDILAIFSTDSSLGGASVLTLAEAGKSIPEEPASICDIAKAYSLSSVTIVDDRIDGYQEAVKNLQKAKIAQLVFGLKMTCCADHEDKTEASLRTESKVIIFIKNTQGYKDLIKIHNTAANTDFYNQARTSWKRLNELWTPNLVLAIPYFSGFLFKNSMTLSSVIPDFPIPPKDVWVLREVDSGLPFTPILDAAIDQFVTKSGAQVQKVKTIYYPTPERFKGYVVMRAIDNRATFSRPEVPHLASNRFNWERYVELVKGAV